jgi:hypothetical protein
MSLSDKSVRPTQIVLHVDVPATSFEGLDSERRRALFRGDEARSSLLSKFNKIHDRTLPGGPLLRYKPKSAPFLAFFPRSGAFKLIPGIMRRDLHLYWK